MRVIDCDAHVEESIETWQYLDPECRGLIMMNLRKSIRWAAASSECLYALWLHPDLEFDAAR
jgi:hypothetical protein